MNCRTSRSWNSRRSTSAWVLLKTQEPFFRWLRGTRWWISGVPRRRRKPAETVKAGSTSIVHFRQVRHSCFPTGRKIAPFSSGRTNALPTGKLPIISRCCPGVSDEHLKPKHFFGMRGRAGFCALLHHPRRLQSGGFTTCSRRLQTRPGSGPGAMAHIQCPRDFPQWPRTVPGSSPDQYAGGGAFSTFVRAEISLRANAALQPKVP